MTKKSKIILTAIFTGVLIGGAILIWRLGVTPEEGSPKSEAQTPPDSGWKTYTHAGYGFSFEYPKDWTISSFNQGDGEVILIQQSASNQRSNQRDISGIQIYISMFDEPQTALTKERILKDIPDMVINNDKQVKIANTIDGLSFDSANQSGEATREVWFVYNNFLYQISSATGSEEVLDKIMETWRFN